MSKKILNISYKELLSKVLNYDDYRETLKKLDESVDTSKVKGCNGFSLTIAQKNRLISLMKHNGTIVGDIGKPLLYIEKFEIREKIHFSFLAFGSVFLYLLLVNIVITDFSIDDIGGCLMLFLIYSGSTYMTTDLMIDSPYFFTKRVFLTLLFPFNKFNYIYYLSRHIIGRKGVYWQKNVSTGKCIYLKCKIEKEDFFKVLELECQNKILFYLQKYNK